QLIGLGESPSGAEGSISARRRVDEVITDCGWPDLPSEDRKALARHLENMADLGLKVSDGLLTAYARAADIAATADIAGSVSENRDMAAMKVAVGVHSHTQLLLRTVALAQASLTLQRYPLAEPAEPAMPE